MTRRSTPQRIIDDQAFPIRIQFMLPWNGFGQRYDVYLAWLKRLGPDEWARHSAALYVRSLEIAAQFLAAFPELRLADGAETRSRPGRVS